MKNGFILWSCILGAAMGGYWAGRQHVFSAPVARTVTVAAGVNQLPPPLLPVLPTVSTNAATNLLSEKMSLADVMARMLVLKADGDDGLNNDPDQKWSKLLASVNLGDIPQVLAFADQNLTANLRASVRNDLLSRWADADPSGALAYAGNISDKSERHAATGMVVQAWAGADATAAAAWVQRQPDGPFRNQLLNEVLTAMSRKDPAAACGIYLGLDSASRRKGILTFAAEQIFQAWAAKDPATAIAQAAGIPTQQRGEVYDAIVRVWAGTDPQAALKWADAFTNANAGEKNSLLGSILSIWAGNDFSGALAHVKALPDGAAKSQALSSVIQQWGQQDPQAALDYIATLPSSRFDAGLLNPVISAWLEDDPDAAGKYVQALPAGSQRNILAQNIVSRLANQDPQAAIQMLGLLPASSLSSATHDIAQTRDGNPGTKRSGWRGAMGRIASVRFHPQPCH